jgi:hypothetical protein
LRTFVLIAIGIVLVGATAILVITLTPGGSAPSEPRAPALAVDRAPAPPPPPDLPGALPVTPMPAPKVDYEPPRTTPPDESWNAVKQVAQLSAMGPVGVAVWRDLFNLKPRLAACSDEESRTRRGGQRPVVADPESRPEETGATVLVLLLETHRGEVRIVDAPLENRGAASDAAIICAQRILRGRIVQVPEAYEGEKVRVTYPLAQ